MFITADTVEPGSRIDTDLCIIGAGPAGTTIAREFDKRGVRVMVLESGDMTSSLRTHRLTSGRSTGQSYHRLLLSRDRAFGGTSPRWPKDEGWHARPLDPIDFESRPEVPHSGWPLKHEDLEAYLARAQEISDLGPATYDVADWEGPHLGERLPLDPDVVHTTIFQLGTTDFSRFRSRFARSTDVTVMLRATVMEIATRQGGTRVDRVVVARPDGERFSVSARRFVLAAGGIDNPRLLLMSTDAQPRGLGNGHDLVGRFFMERLSTRSGYVEPHDERAVRAAELYANKSVPAAAMPPGTTPTKPINLEGVLRLNEDVLRAEGLRNGVFFVLRRSRAWMSEGVRSAGTLVKSVRRQPLPDGIAGHVGNVVRELPQVAAVVAQRVRPPAAEDQVLLLRAQAEQAPNPESRVLLSRQRDHLGSPRPEVRWRTTADDRASIRRSQELIGDAFARAGLGRLVVNFGDEDPPAMFEGNLHHLGTTRMATRPEDGVVDPDCRLHGVDNLFVAGSSVFPTAGASNPTLALIQLSLRLADHLRRLYAPGSS